MNAGTDKSIHLLIAHTYDAVSYTHLDVYKRQILDDHISSAFLADDIRLLICDLDLLQILLGCLYRLIQIRVKVLYDCFPVYLAVPDGIQPVSYTHLDVYKRQPQR